MWLFLAPFLYNHRLPSVNQYLHTRIGSTILELITKWDRESAGTLLLTLCFSPVLKTIQLYHRLN